MSKQVTDVIGLMRLLQVETLLHKALQTGFVEDVVSKFLVGEHGQCGALGSGHQFRSFFDREVGVLADHGHHHANHDLQATDLDCFLVDFVGRRVFQGDLVSATRASFSGPLIRCRRPERRCAHSHAGAGH